ncbi:MAG: 5-oxoprolinase subunit PxpA [Campylobacterota bacterium]|nr:5-oxoprolinase subunit PxpA [Campylobacterota bacterium]
MSSNSIKINCDMGEYFAFQKTDLNAKVMPYIDMANLACGFHAGDPVTMHQSIKESIVNDVAIGAHPSYPDLAGFGRRPMQCSVEEIVSFVIYQCGALDALCKSYDTKIRYVKPHGALYNTMMQDTEVFKSIAKAISKYDTEIPLMILSSTENESYATLANRYGISLLYEVFADRAYQDNGHLVPRSEEHALLHSTHEILQRAKILKEKGYIESINGKKIPLQSDTLCVHGDNPHAVEIIQALHRFNHEN